MTRDDLVEHEAAEWGQFVAKVARLVSELTLGYRQLHSMTTPARASIKLGGGGGGSVHPAVPIDLDVLDLIAEIEAEVGRLVSLARGALRLGLVVQGNGRRAGQRTLDGLEFLGASIRGVWEADPGTGELVVDTLWALRGRVRGYTYEGPRAYRTLRPCGSCGEVSLVVDAVRARVRCVSCGTTDP